MQNVKIIAHHSSVIEEYNFLITCQSGLESLVKRECEKLGLENVRGQDRLVKCSGTEKNMYELLIWSRFANRVYLSLGEQKITDFDSLFETLESIAWRKYLSGKENIVIEASSTRSALGSVPTIQSVSQKAIYSSLNTPNTTSGTEAHVLILIIDDIAHVLLDITGNPLHKRGYRQEAGEAPIKENLGAAMVAFANWKYKTPLLDPFCGSGTIAIEAAMMARNIAPGLDRHYRVEEFPFYKRELLSNTKEEARKKSYPSGKYQILASDIDAGMIRIAEENAKRAGVSDDIVFEVRDFLSGVSEMTNSETGVRGEGTVGTMMKKDGSKSRANSEGVGLSPETFGTFGHESTENGVGEKNSSPTIVTNPPYGNRLQNADLEKIYKKLDEEIRKNGGGFITSYHIENTKDLANKKLLNGSEECRFWYKKSI